MGEFINFFLSLTWQDILDVFISSYIVFRLYVLFRGTAVLRVLIGILFLVALQRFTSFLGLVLTSWAIQGITAAAALIIIVIFRNEIRSVLQARNLTAILWGNPVKEHLTPTDIIIKSVKDLAQRRCGALLVFPGDSDISDALHSGTDLDCHISREALLSIFWPGSPLHDGAALIYDGRIRKAGVVLPISSRSDLPSHYGTRHRAALGLAERSDALVIAISEERGTVTAAVGGRFIDISDDETFSRILENQLIRPIGHSKQARSEKKRRIAAACASFALVAIIWFGITRGTDSFLAFDVPIEYINRNPALDIVDASVNTVKLYLGGSGSLVKSLRPEQIHVRIDLRLASPGLNHFSISTEQIQIPPGIFVKKIEPSAVNVLLDAIVQKKIPIQVDWTGHLPKAIVISSCSVEPPDILVEGPRQVLDRVTTLYTEKINVDTIERSGTVTVSVVLTPPSLRIVSGSDRVTVNFSVQHRKKQPSD